MVADLAVKISADIKQLQKNIGTAKATLKNFGATATSVGTKLTASLTLPIAGVGITALKTASDFEQLEVRLKTLTGSARAGTKQFQRLQQFSAGTPFQLQDLVQANNTLLGFGMNAEDAFTSLQQLGDVASATGADLQSIAVAFGQSSAEGKLFTRDIRQFINQGVPAVDLLAQSMGVARSEVFTLAEEGKISFQILQDAIAKSTQAGGKFAGATQAQSQTIAGLFST
jgi:tape measure domain-containing protein